MRISVKCSSAIHALLILSVLTPGQKKSSDALAASVGCNPVEIRKLLIGLKKAGLVDVARGPGGASLKLHPKNISLLDIYSAVDSASLNELIGVHAHPDEHCPFGRNIAELLSEPYAQIGNAVREEMACITLEHLLEKLIQMEPAVQALKDKR